MNCVLDACAMIALLKAESGEDVVWAHLLDPHNTVYAHSLNLCEVYYHFHRHLGEARAEGALEDLRYLGVVERSDFDEPFWKEAGKLKAGGNIALADCIAVTLTNRVGGTVLTSDHGEFDPVAAAGVCPVTFIR
jgi:predicted nucleic acid-binding protein